jgi:MYXO-CTERM domain-containing protein
MRIFVVPCLAAAALAGSASAAFLGFSVVQSTNSEGNIVNQVFANWDAADGAVLLNCFGITSISGPGLGSGNFWHNDLINGNVSSQTSGTWSPGFVGLGDPALDSWVTIGGGPGFSNTWTTSDPDWGAPGFGQAGIPEGAGWFNNNPPNLAGAANAEGQTLVGQWVTSPAAGPAYTLSLQVGYNFGLGTDTVFGGGEFTIGVPGPGALALLGLAGLTGRRRRRA